MKNKKVITTKVSSILKNGAAFDRLAFFILILILLSHLVGCLWIYIGGTFQEPDTFGDSWIEASGFEPLGMLDLYIASLYFTI